MEGARGREIRRLRLRLGAGQIVQIPVLPEEVVAEILSWLPVKSLLRFRCVSKFWRSLIDSKHFVRSHLEKSGKHPGFARHRIIAHSHKPYDGLNPTLRHFSLPSLLNEPITHLYDFDDALCASNAMLLVVGSCDGLICVLSSTNKFFLWNPTIRIFRQLPCVDDELNGWYVSEFGFGLDESSGDYKVFCIVMSYGDRFAAEGKVYSLQTNSWKRIECVDGSLVSRVGQFVSGKLHWLWRSVDNPRVDIVSFDLEKEVYGKMQLPCRIDSHYELSLGKVEECLYVLCGHQRSRLDVWVMKQYGVHGSWTKVMTLPYFTDSWDRSFSMPLFMGQNGEILLSDWPNFLIYNPKDKRAWNPRMNSEDEIVDAHVYIESLVSPVSSGEQ